jgi:hypothetical protein
MQSKLLSIYLNDHLAGATAGVAVARRAAKSNRDSEAYGAPLEELAEEIGEDRESLLQLMSDLEVGTDTIKQLLAWGAEKAGRLKLNGHLLSYSPLSRLDELEFLTLGVTGKLSLWRTLDLLSHREPRLRKEKLGELVVRAEMQLKTIATCRQHAVIDAFTV